MDDGSGSVRGTGRKGSGIISVPAIAAGEGEVVVSENGQNIRVIVSPEGIGAGERNTGIDFGDNGGILNTGRKLIFETEH